jgi:DNA-binding SARP family transcriptional activator/tRNA A-37 threonylcarbamoyl transferase component Bud32
MEFRILGPLEVVTDEGAVPLGGPKQRAVLAHLILRANHPVHADRLIDGLWGDEPPETARNTLQTYVYRLRKLLGDARVDGSNGAYVLNASADEIDAARFESIVREAKSLESADPVAAAARFSDALTLWRGAPLADLADEPSLRGEAARLEELHLSAMEHRIAAEIASGEHSTVVSELEALTSRYPLRERMWANLMLALYHSGRQAEALSTYERAREVLSTELGTDPSQQLQRLHEQMLRRDPALGPDSRPATVRPSRIDLPPGTEFASYRIERTLGRGGMSVVYLAEHEWLQRKVALKVLAPQLAEDDRFRERFIRESRLAASLDHPNVIPIYEAGGSGGDLFIAMRYVEGSDLRTLLQEVGALDPARAIAIVRQAAAALDAAHEQGLVHRDVKPGNVLLTRARSEDEAEHVYLSDFGLTKRTASDSGVTGTGQFVGTLDYAAPEQFQGGTPDARTDVYSLGCVLFECLTGRPPFQSDNDAALMYAHLQEPPPAVTAIEPGLPREIDRVVATAMAKAPTDRYPSAGVLAREASRALGLGAGTAEGGPEKRSVVRRLLPAIAAGVALIVGILVASLFQGDQPLPEAEGSVTAPSASPSPTVPPTFRTVERALTADEQLLLTYIPGEVGTECLPLDRAEPLHGERASLVCRKPDLEVLYQLFQTRDEMDEALQVNVNNKQAQEGECATETVAVGPYTVGNEPAGQVLCYTIERNSQPGIFGSGNAPDQSHIEWTDENTSIYAHAVRNDLGDLSLYEWWVTSSGPIVPGGSDAPTEKDRPTGATGSVPGDGSYLASPAGGCSGFRGVDCAMHINGDTYTQVFSDPALQPAERGAILLQKPDAVVFSPVTGYCFEPEELGGGGDSRPAAYTWTAEGDEFRFERVGGGRCAGPQKLSTGAWAGVPDGLIAIEQGGEIELMTPGGALAASTTQAITDPNTWPDWSPDGSRIVFSGAGQGEQGFDLYVMNADGSEVERITDLSGDEFAPAWSPDGERILFGFDDGDSADQRTALVTVAPDGSGLTELITRDGAFLDLPTWSPDGEEIGFTLFSGGAIEAYRMAADGSDLTRLRGDLAVLLGWTPDGRRILLSADTSLITVRPDGTGEQVFLEDPPENGRLVVDWSPDGLWLVASTPHGATTVSGPARTRVYLIRSDGSETFWVGSGAEPSWRPEMG